MERNDRRINHEVGRGRTDPGFTLVEIMIVLVIFAIGTIIAIPNLQKWVYQNNASGFHREMFSELQEARIRASSASMRYRFVVNLGNETAILQSQTGGAWSNARNQIAAPGGSAITSVVATAPGGTVTTVTSGTYGLVFNPSGEVYGQPTISDDNTIVPLTQAAILLGGVNPGDNASITVFGWTGKARLN